MLSLLPRALRVALALAAALPLGLQAAPPSPPAAEAADALPWLYKGSDIPVDREWVFGVLPNGVRYAVRRNGVPPGQVAIRIGIEAGSLMEEDSERGYAHLIEHLSFRGSRYLKDGEAKRVWQRLGATFGSDTNASTTSTQTIYKLDLPSVRPEGLDESLKLLSGMMMAPSLTPEEVEAERRTVLAEGREQTGPEFRVAQTSRQLFFARQRMADRSPIGTPEALAAATSQSLRAFHDRWYRPERTVIAIAGDQDPTTLAALVRKHFGDWRGKGPNPPDPDFGKPSPQARNMASIAAPGLSLEVNAAWLRPWFQKNDTIAYNQGKMVDLVAMRVLNRRLETRARAGASFVRAAVGQEDASRTADMTYLTLQPLANDWQAAVRDVRAIIAEALVTPPDLAEIKREEAELYDAFQIGVETARTEAGAKLADDILLAVDIRETVASAQVAHDVFTGLRDKITPAMVLESTKRLFAGEGPRAFLTSPDPLADADQKLAQAFSEPVRRAAVRTESAPLTFAALPKQGKPGVLSEKADVRELDLTFGRYPNGVRVTHFHNPAESGKVYVAVRFGAGKKALSATKPGLLWAGPAALYAGGIGKLGQDQLDRMTSGRKIGFQLEAGDDAFVIRAQTRSSDLADQLRLIAAKLQHPRWDAAPVNRARAAFLSGLDSFETSPQGVMARDLEGLLRNGDVRWTTPQRREIEALTPAAFRKFWAPLLASGPIEVMVFGDVPWAEAEAATAAAFGSLPARKPARIVDARTLTVSPSATPLLRTHKGEAERAAAVMAWPTGGGIKDAYESRKLELLAQIFGDRMFDQLREAQGASYSPIVDSSWPTGMENGGNFVVIAQLKPSDTDRFYKLVRGIAADLTTKPPTKDEMARAVNPMKERIARASTGSQFWLRNLEGANEDRERINALRTILVDFNRITPEELRDTARRWLKPDGAMMLNILPEAKAAGR